MSEDRCVICGAYVPEGRIVCPECEKRPMKNLSHGEMVQIAEEKKSRMQQLINGRFCTPLTFELTFEQSSKRDTCLMCGRPFKGLVEQKKGTWEVCGAFDDFLKCSCCGYKKPWNEDIFNFCPRCGADMREETNAEVR